MIECIMESNIASTSQIGVYAVIIKDNKILLIKRNTGPYKELLDLPGGGFEINESLYEGLSRIIQEETGFNIISYTQLPVFTTFYNYTVDNQEYCLRHLAIVYKLETNNRVEYKFDNEEYKNYTWINLPNIGDHLLSPLVKKAITLI